MSLLFSSSLEIITKLIKFIRTETLAEGSSALGSTEFEPQRVDPLGMEAAVVGYISIVIIGIVIDTLVAGTLVSSVTRPEHETIA